MRVRLYPPPPPTTPRWLCMNVSFHILGAHAHTRTHISTVLNQSNTPGTPWHGHRAVLRLCAPAVLRRCGAHTHTHTSMILHQSSTPRIPLHVRRAVLRLCASAVLRRRDTRGLPAPWLPRCLRRPRRLLLQQDPGLQGRPGRDPLPRVCVQSFAVILHADRLFCLCAFPDSRGKNVPESPTYICGHSLGRPTWCVRSQGLRRENVPESLTPPFSLLFSYSSPACCSVQMRVRTGMHSAPFGPVPHAAVHSYLSNISSTRTLCDSELLRFDEEEDEGRGLAESAEAMGEAAKAAEEDETCGTQVSLPPSLDVHPHLDCGQEEPSQSFPCSRSLFSIRIFAYILTPQDAYSHHLSCLLLHLSACSIGLTHSHFLPPP